MFESGSVSKYTLYAIGEIVPVVIGILIAIQINNWNESRKARSFELKLLEEMQVALLANKDWIIKKRIDRSKQSG